MSSTIILIPHPYHNTEVHLHRNMYKHWSCLVILATILVTSAQRAKIQHLKKQVKVVSTRSMRQEGWSFTGVLFYLRKCDLKRLQKCSLKYR